jgi:hypothetical protein
MRAPDAGTRQREAQPTNTGEMRGLETPLRLRQAFEMTTCAVASFPGRDRPLALSDPQGVQKSLLKIKRRQRLDLT